METTDRDYQAYLKEKAEKAKLAQLRNNGDKLLYFFYNFVNPANSCAGYFRPHFGYCNIQNWRNQPVSWSINTYPVVLGQKDDTSFYLDLPIYLLEGDVELNAWMLAQAWGWAHVGKAIREIYIYDYNEWKNDWILFWGLLSKHISNWGLF